ncbi:type IV pilin [Halobacterium salinarum]|uniref:type IV pilin n=1 Tax=Halobacterium salinarum TaxID=2242 RepID=UPI0025531B5A|nr:type IV pilin [Halobacterium salinarum]MDL0137497.1 type IV pilin [Halobacterium salinarum]MDL0140263.1 type IV pilin [Halobacterium salinarum]
MKTIKFDIPDLDMDDRGVSPVIGVILMVAITVILAAVIASFVLGFGDDVSQNVQAGADISQDDGTATVTWISEGNAQYLNVSADGEHIPDGDGESLSSVGDTVEINSTSSNPDIDGGSTDIVVTAVGSGGSETVILQETVQIDEDTDS